MSHVVLIISFAVDLVVKVIPVSHVSICRFKMISCVDLILDWSSAS